MKHFNNILIGVDLSDGDKFVSEDLTSPTLEAIDLGIRLAKECHARAHFFYSLDISAHAQRAIQEDSEAESTVLGKANQLLDKLVDRAKKQCVDAQPMVTFGKSWIEIIRYVLREQCDFVVVGAKQHGALEELFIGSTGMNLLRSCPCPVWVTHPPRPDSNGAILVAHDLTEVGDRALEIGATVAEYRGAPLHVMHVLEPQHVDIADPLTIAVRVADDSRQNVIDKISTQLDHLDLSVAAEIHVAEGAPESELRSYINQHNIDLLVMGTLARTGIQGLLIGNTAERLLPQVPCSVVAIKPADFHSPVTSG